MSPTGESMKTPEGQSTNIESGPPPEPPFTPEQKAAQAEEGILAGLPEKEIAAEEDGTALEAVEKKFNEQPPPVEFTEEAGAVIDLRNDKAKLAELQKGQERPGGTGEKEQSQPDAEAPEGTEPVAEPGAEPLSAERQPQPEPEIPEGPKPEKGKVAEQPKAEIRPRLPHEAPVRPEATREQTAELLQRKLEEALDKIYTKIEANKGQMPEDLATFDEVKEIFTGSRVVAENTVNSQIEQLKAVTANFQTDQGRVPTREEFKGLGTKALHEQLGLLAQENPQEIKKSPFLKQQTERDASHQPGRSPDVPVQNNPMPPETEDQSRASNKEPASR